MFTGIITGQGRIAEVAPLGATEAHGKRLVIQAPKGYLDDVGLGDSIAQLLATNTPAPQEYVAVNDSFGESGTPAQLMTKYGLDAEHIIKAVQKVIARKKA